MTEADWTPLPFGSSDWAPVRDPSHAKPSSDGKSLTINTGSGTDYWRVPFPAPGRDDNSAGYWGFKRKVGKEGFEVRCEIEVRPSEQQFDQGAMLLQLSPTEWVKTGAEFDQGEMWHGAVICNPFSDWSIQPLSSKSRFTISFDPSTTTLRIFLGPPGSTDPKEDMMIREVKSFGLISAGLTHLVPGEVPADVDPAEKLAEMEVSLGVLACSPIGKGLGPECVFRGFEVREGTRKV